MKFKWLNENVLEVRFKTAFELCDSTYRFSHHYEEPTFQGKIFSREDLDSFYKENHGDPDFWKKRWAGANLPDHSFSKFISGEFTNLSKFETKLLKKLKDKTAPYYVIMTCDDSLYARDHELAHAFYYTDKEYRHTVDKIINDNLESLSSAVKELTDLGYSGSVLIDELHVYCGIYYGHFFKFRGVIVDKEIISALEAAFELKKSKAKLKD